MQARAQVDTHWQSGFLQLHNIAYSTTNNTSQNAIDFHFAGHDTTDRSTTLAFWLLDDHDGVRFSHIDPMTSFRYGINAISNMDGLRNQLQRPGRADDLVMTVKVLRRR